MSLKINTNTGSAFSNYQLQKGHRALSQSLERFSTGKRINKASDDAPGMMIANTLSSQARGYGQAIRNSNDAIAITQVADGALGQASDIVQDIRVKALQAANASQSPESRLANQLESSINTLHSAMINTISAKSEIEDLDFTKESMNLNKIKILGKTQAFAQAQANASAKNILDLFG